MQPQRCNKRIPAEQSHWLQSVVVLCFCTHSQSREATCQPAVRLSTLFVGQAGDYWPRIMGLPGLARVFVFEGVMQSS